MKEKNLFLKFLSNALSMLSAVTFNVQAQTDSQVLPKFQEHIDTMVQSYESSTPLMAQIFNMADPNIKGFLDGSTHRKNTEHLAMFYYPQMKVDGQTTSFCFIFYDPQQKVFQNYRRNTTLQEEEIIEYLAIHEMAHCFLAHSNIRQQPKQNELLADLMSIAYMLNQGKDLLAIKILYYNAKLPSGDIHANSALLEDFYLYCKEEDRPCSGKKLQQLQSLVLSYFSKLSLSR